MKTSVLALTAWLLVWSTATADISVSGQCVDEDNQPIQGAVRISVTVSGVNTPLVFLSNVNGTYAFTVPIQADRIIEEIVYEHPERHPGVDDRLSGRNFAATKDIIINKVLLPRVGPQGFERNMEQYLSYEHLAYLATERKTSMDPAYKQALLEMPNPNGNRERDITLRNTLKDRPDLVAILVTKRNQVLGLFGMSGQTASCQSFVCFRRGIFHRRG